jgi:hypothetical protein
MTPRETVAFVEAAAWRMEQEQRARMGLAWHIAALSRAKKLPPLQRMLGGGRTRKLEGEELEKRRREHEEAIKNWELGIKN